MAKKFSKKELKKRYLKVERNNFLKLSARKSYVRPAEFALPEDSEMAETQG